MAKKVADQLVDTLEKAGVRRIYAVTGDSLNEVNEAVRKTADCGGFMSVMRKRGLCRCGGGPVDRRVGLLRR